MIVHHPELQVFTYAVFSLSEPKVGVWDLSSPILYGRKRVERSVPVNSHGSRAGAVMTSLYSLRNALKLGIAFIWKVPIRAPRVTNGIAKL